MSETFIRTQADALLRSNTAVVTFGSAPIRSPLALADDVFPYSHYNVARLMNRFVFDSTRNSKRLEGRMRDRDLDIIHAHFGTDAGMITPTARRLGLPLVVSVYGADVTRELPDTRRGRRDAARLREAFDYASVITANSEYMRRRALELGADPQKTLLVHLGVEFHTAAARSLGSREGVLFVGRFSEKKGASDLVSAMALLPSHIRDYPVTLIGDGPLRGVVQDQARQLGVNARFLGSQPHAVVRDEIDRALLLAAPSKTASDGDSEGLPTIILEAAAAGLPVVSTVHSGIPEAVISGETGLLVHEGVPAELASALATLIRSPEVAEAMGRRGRKFVRREFDSDLCATRLQEIYARVVGGTK